MKKKILILLMLFLSITISAQDYLVGKVNERDQNGNVIPLIGANIIWLNTNHGTTTDINGDFQLHLTNESNKLIVSFIGYKTDTLTITNQRNIEIILETDAKELSDVEIVGKQQSAFQDYKGTENTTIITKKELQKAACCTLAESFETNPSIDVSFTDAITGARQIEMLGLAGTYTQTTMENLPYIRGLMSNVGLSFVPGTWINAINVSKGVGSVANGHESLTGQIDIDMQKPFDETEEKNGFLNLYGDNERRFEGNFNYRFELNENLSSMTLLHSSSRQHMQDINSDSFMDMPTFKTYNVMQRWQYLSYTGWESQFGFQIVNDKKQGGTTSSVNNPSSLYNFGSTNNLFNIYGKTGYVDQEDVHNSFGLQWSYSNYKNSSFFGTRKYDADQKNVYLNFIYQSELSEAHKYRAGVSFLFDQFDEQFFGSRYDRVERVPGIFLEYTYNPSEQLTVVAGMRADNHNYYGFMFTPRLHVRYSPHEDWVFRAAAGKGYRTSNIFVEYSSAFASARNINVLRSNNFGYGLEQESAWNYGLNATYYFLYDYRDASISLDFYRTDFEKVNIADLDTNPQSITFASVANGSYSNSFQAELNMEPFPFFSTRLAYRFVDAKQLINGTWMDKPFSAKHRALVNFAYATQKETNDDSQMLYDLTLQWFGSKRIPSTKSNPVNLQARENSPSFILVNAQVTRSFSQLFDLYLGVENLFNFRQNDPIIDPTNPGGQFFDASLIWGPVNGRMVYAGLRYKM
jgi:outer membrane receptor for ferrienterochelin and colicin